MLHAASRDLVVHIVVSPHMHSARPPSFQIMGAPLYTYVIYVDVNYCSFVKLVLPHSCLVQPLLHSPTQTCEYVLSLGHGMARNDEGDL